MHPARVLCLAAVFAVPFEALSQEPALPPPAQRSVDFAREIQPIFRARCLACHGAAQQLSGLRLDNRAEAMKGGYSGPVIQSGDSAASALIHRVAGQGNLMVMPPTGERLTAEQIALLRAWIDQGAQWPDQPAKPQAAETKRPRSSHWAFQPVRRPEPPKPRDASGVRNPIDAFIQARLEKEGIRPSPEADRATLLRRVHLDLIGLPPTPQELADFLADKRPDAYERVVDRLLRSPHYGEKWARYWLDLARYADSDGYEKDWVRPHAWRWREWVIDAINRDMPYDRFTLEQMAGDLLPGATIEQRVATGFHRNTLTNREGGVDNKQFIFENTVDRTSTVGTVWLGLTMGCAQCHDHKYDPISQKDFYQLFAFFDNIEEVDIDAPMPGELGPWLAKKDEYERKRQDILNLYCVPELMADWERNILRAGDHPGERTDWDLAWDVLLKLTVGGDGEKIIRKPPEQRTAREQRVLTDHFVRNYHFAIGKKKTDELGFEDLVKKLDELDAQYPQLSQAYTIAENGASKTTHLRVRGDYKTPGIAVEADVPAVLPPLKKSGERATRLDLARWLTSPENPLTARVAVNRFWQEFFGHGLVRTSDDFGTQGESPSHPDLLDWLASEFRDNGWSMKKIHRLIVTSSAYRRDSAARPDLDSKDPDNRLLARQNRLRLPAELIRDSALFASGLLDMRVGGRSIRPPQPEGVTAIGYAGGTKWPVSEGTERYRRGLYIHFQRTTPYPLLVNFDAPKGTVTSCKRLRTNTPLQALNLLNDPVFLEAARALAWRVHREAPAEFEARLEYAFLLTLARKPEEAEKQRLRQYFERQKSIFDSEAGATKALGVDSLEMAAWTGLSSVLLNLDEFIVRE
jgi:mono/diheme cytochrome c family protein